MLCVPQLLSSVHEMDCMREVTVPVPCRSGSQSSVVSTSSKRDCVGCEGSRVILTALLLTLDGYSSWRVRRVVPMFRSAVWVTLCTLCKCCSTELLR